jgi:hypothetical protein
MSEEKKFKLDELPEKGSSVSEKPQLFKRINTSEDPRLKEAKNLTEEEKLLFLSKRWSYDRPLYHFDWLIYVLLLSVIEYKDFLSGVAQSLRPQTSDEILNVGLSFFDLPIVIAQSVLAHPSIFVLLTPFFFKLKSASPYGFIVTFDGLETVKSFNLVDGQTPERINIKWSEIVRIEKARLNKRSVLLLHGHDFRIGLLIWDLNKHQKKSIELILKGLVPAAHPLRKFIEKDIA